MLANRVRMGSGGESSIFPPYIYLNGEEGIELVDGYSEGTRVSITKELDYIRFQSSTGTASRKSLVTNHLVDLNLYNNVVVVSEETTITLPLVNKEPNMQYIRFEIRCAPWNSQRQFFILTDIDKISTGEINWVSSGILDFINPDLSLSVTEIYLE